MSTVLRRAVSAGMAAVVARGAQRSLAEAPPGGARMLSRRNHAGGEVTLAEGPAAVAGLLAGIGVTPGLTTQQRLVAIGAVAAIGAVGAYDDLFGSTSAKGLHGHVAALRHGEVTSGIVKIVVIGVGGLVSATPWQSGGDVRTSRRLMRHVVDGALVAGLANLVNLFDLRPGRALKVSTLALPLALMSAPAGGLAAPVLGVVLGTGAEDLAARSMLGDCGANALGAVAGIALIGSTRANVRTSALVVVAAVTLASERVSFGAIIESHPVLSAIDSWGRAGPSS